MQKRILSGRRKQFLDLFPGAIGAWSLRQLSFPAVAVVRVRRSSDNAEQDFFPNQITNGELTDWVGAANDGSVSVWYDQSGNGAHQQPPSPAEEPFIVESGGLITKNGKPAVKYNSGNGRTTATVPGLSDVANLSTFVVDSPSLASAPDTISNIIFGYALGGDSEPNQGFNFGVTTGLLAGETYTFTFAGLNLQRLGSSNYSHAAGEQLFHAIFNLGTGLESWKNGVQISFDLSSGNLTTSSPVSPEKTGSALNTFHLNSNNGVGNGPEKLYQEVIIYPADKKSDRVDIESNLTTYYGT
jgi:hypothetical protein